MIYFFLLSLYLIGFSLSYNPSQAYAYAEKWAYSRNPAYADYSDVGGDCANFVSQCIMAGGFSTSGCPGTWGTGGTIPNVGSLESCLIQKGWASSSSIPPGGMPVGSVITFNNAAHATLVVKAGSNPLIAGHTTDTWMGSSNWGTGNKYFWVKGGSSSSIIWYPYVNGYNINDGNNGYAGEIGVPVVALRVKSGKYAVHELGGSWITASDNEVAGKGNSIDGVAVAGGVKYRVHVVGGGWLSPVNKYDLNDSDYGMAGIYGKIIDAIAIEGKTYASAHN
jgi:hypothetical protein